MVIRGDSKSEGREFESRHRLLDGHFFTLICCKIVIVCFKKTKNELKKAEDGTFLRLPKKVISNEIK